MVRHAIEMAELINEHKYAKIAEIGVWKGWFLNGIFCNCPEITEYWGIDSWNVKNVPGDPLPIATQKEWTAIYLKVCNVLKYYYQLKIIKADSIEAAKIFPEGYFDFVFIDGDHSYESVRDDVKAWTPLIRKGGMITGHDCTKRRPGVPKALNEIFGNTFQRLPATCWKKEIL